MEIKVTQNLDETIIEVVGRLDTVTAPSLEQAISDKISEIKNLVLDFKGLEYVSSAGLRVLLSTHKKMQKIGLMKVKNVNEVIMEVFEMTGFTDILTIE